MVFKRTFLVSTKHQREGYFPKGLSEPKENQIMLEKTKAKTNVCHFAPTRYFGSASVRAFLFKAIYWFYALHTTKSRLTLHVPSGFTNGTNVIFSPPCAGKLFPGCTKTYVDIWSLRLKKQIEETATYCQRILFMATINNDFLYDFKETQRHNDVNKSTYHTISYAQVFMKKTSSKIMPSSSF